MLVSVKGFVGSWITILGMVAEVATGRVVFITEGVVVANELSCGIH